MFYETNFGDISCFLALNGDEREEWKDAIYSEFKQIVRNDTWDIIEKPSNINLIDSKLVLTNKTDTEGNIVKKKARLIARGFSQVYGLDYFNTFSPVARIESFRLLIALSMQFNLQIIQLDVTNAFLNGNLKEEVFMKIPKLFDEMLNYMSMYEEDTECRTKAKQMLSKMQDTDKVCLLKKSLYGLKQAGRAWNIKIDSFLKELNLKSCKNKPCIYYDISEEYTIIMIVYVDDILIAHNCEIRANEIKMKLSSEFEIKDLGFAKNCIGVEIERLNDQIKILQKKHIRKVVEKFKMIDANMIDTPADPNVLYELKKSNEKVVLPFRELIGNLTYIAVCTRPDIMHTITFLSQFNSCYSTEHWNAAKRVIRYLMKTIDYGLVYYKCDFTLNGYVDADWASNKIDRKSFTGYLFKFAGSAISWKSQKQKTVALSSAEAEYMAICEAVKELIYLRNIFVELDLMPKIFLYNDNKSAHLLTENNVFHARSKHIDIRHHFIREVLKKKIFELNYLETDKMMADIMTKPLPYKKHMFCMNNMGMKQII